MVRRRYCLPRIPALIARLLLAVECLIPFLTLGCGRGGPEMVPVKGTVTFGGGPWPKPGVLYFTVESSAPGLPARPATGKFDVNGTLTVTTFKTGDGLIPGKYKLVVECWEIPPRMDSPVPAKSYVPARFGSAATSGLDLTVSPNQGLVNLNLDIAKK